MCTHYAFMLGMEALRAMFDLAAHMDYPVRYNVAPNQVAPIIVWEPVGRVPVLARWGFRKSGASVRPVNARAETVARSPLFKGSFRERRCVVPVSGFYEPRKKPGMKRGDQQWYFSAAAEVLPLAGIFAAPTDEGETPTFAVITTDANETVGRVHHRMPVILDEPGWRAWLDPEIDDADSLGSLLAPSTPAGFAGRRVKMEYVNRPSEHDGPECIEPYEASGEAQPGLFGDPGG
ncbi:MAG: SOS response-associated peptidase [Phycisphaerales bacterium]